MFGKWEKEGKCKKIWVCFEFLTNGKFWCWFVVFTVEKVHGKFGFFEFFEKMIDFDFGLCCLVIEKVKKKVQENLDLFWFFSNDKFFERKKKEKKEKKELKWMVAYVAYHLT